MTEQVITIKEVIEKQGTKGLFKIVTPEVGNKMYAFDSVTFPSLVPGKTVKVTIDQQGQYPHIKGVGAVETPHPTPQPPPPPPQPANKPITPPPPVITRSTNESIEGQVALKCLSELDIAGKLPVQYHDALLEKLGKTAGLVFEEVKPAPQPIKAVKK